MSESPLFSERNEFTLPEVRIVIRHAKPHELTHPVVQLAYQARLKPSELRDLLCDLLLETPDPDNRIEFPNIDLEIQTLLSRAEWTQFYDFIAAVARRLQDRCDGRCGDPQWHSRPELPGRFTAKINEVFRHRGVGWQLLDGQVVFRGAKPFESSVWKAIAVTKETDRRLAERELREALQDLSKRPNPAITGAIRHAVAALEVTVRDITGNPSASLGELFRKHPELFPAPLHQVVEELWNLVSARGYHSHLGRCPGSTEAELVIGLVGTLVTHLVRTNVPPACVICAVESWTNPHHH